MANPIPSVKEYFDTIHERFRPEAAKGVDAVIQWCITGDEGGDWHVKVTDGAMELGEGVHDDPTLQIDVSDKTYLAVLNKKMPGPMAVMTRKMKVKGNIKLARRMQRMFPA